MLTLGICYPCDIRPELRRRSGLFEAEAADRQVLELLQRPQILSPKPSLLNVALQRRQARSAGTSPRAGAIVKGASAMSVMSRFSSCFFSVGQVGQGGLDQLLNSDVLRLGRLGVQV